MILRLSVLMVAFLSQPLWSTFHYQKWHQDLRWREGINKENCPRHSPHKELESHLQPSYGCACKRARNKALDAKCIPEDIFKMMEFCNLVPRCIPSNHRIYGCASAQCNDVELRSWSFCEESPILSMTSPFAECEKCLDCDFVKNCSLMEGSYFKDLPFEMDFTVRYQFQCKTESGIPVSNIGLKTEKGFMPFEQTLDGTMTLSGKNYLSLMDLNPAFTRDSRLDVNCELHFFEPVKMRLSAHSIETLERNWNDLQLLTRILEQFLSAKNEIHKLHGEKGTDRSKVTTLLEDILAVSEKIGSTLSTNDANRILFNTSIERIQKYLVLLGAVEETNGDFYTVLGNLRQDLDKRIQTITTKMGQLYFQSISLLAHDNELAVKYKAAFDEVYGSLVE